METVSGGSLDPAWHGLRIEFGVPSYDEGPGIVHTLASLHNAAQGCGIQRTHILLSDSSSTPATVAAARRWAEAAGAYLLVDEVRTRRSKKEAVDVIFDRASADVLVMVDADVLVPATSLQLLLTDIAPSTVEVAVGTVAAEPGYRGTWARASAWQMDVVNHMRAAAASGSVHAQGAFVAYRRSFYSNFRFTAPTKEVHSFSEDTHLAQHLKSKGIVTRNSAKAIALKVPARTLHDFYLMTYRSFAAVGGRLERSSWDVRAALAQTVVDPLGALAYVYARFTCIFVARRDRSAFDERWPIARSTKR